MSWRLLGGESVGAAHGLAYDEAMMLPYGKGLGPDFESSLRLYTYRPHCALVGRYQSLHDEIDLEFCRENGIEICRRPTGGGAILMGPDQLGIALASSAPPEMAPGEVLRLWARGVQEGLSRLGITASFRSKNDLEVGGRKIAGLGLYRDEAGALLFHSSVLLDLDIALMLRVLRIPGVKLSDKGISRVEERMTTVSREIGCRIDGEEIRGAFVSGFSETFERSIFPSELDGAERHRMAELVEERFSNTDWIDQRRPRGQARGDALLKTSNGLLRIYVAVQGTVIESIMVTGDFNAQLPGVAALEASLKWSRADREAIAAQVSSHLEEATLGARLDKVERAIWKATSRALDSRQPSHPVRLDGACYAPGLVGDSTSSDGAESQVSVQEEVS